MDQRTLSSEMWCEMSIHIYEYKMHAIHMFQNVLQDSEKQTSQGHGLLHGGKRNYKMGDWLEEKGQGF